MMQYAIPIDLKTSEGGVKTEGSKIDVYFRFTLRHKPDRKVWHNYVAGDAKIIVLENDERYYEFSCMAGQMTSSSVYAYLRKDQLEGMANLFKLLYYGKTDTSAYLIVNVSEENEYDQQKEKE